MVNCLKPDPTDATFSPNTTNYSVLKRQINLKMIQESLVFFINNLKTAGRN